MRPALLFQTVLLLVFGQLTLGAVAYLLPAWLALGVLALFIWLVVRTAKVFRGEVGAANRKGAKVDPSRLALFVSLLWQVPTLLFLGLPDWTLQVWEGALLSISGTIHYISAPAGDALGRWIWLGAFAEMALFALIAGQPDWRPVKPISQVAAARMSGGSGEWAIAKKASRKRQRENILPAEGEE